MRLLPFFSTQPCQSTLLNWKACGAFPQDPIISHPLNACGALSQDPRALLQDPSTSKSKYGTRSPALHNCFSMLCHIHSNGQHVLCPTVFPGGLPKSNQGTLSCCRRGRKTSYMLMAWAAYPVGPVPQFPSEPFLKTLYSLSSRPPFCLVCLKAA